MNVEHSSFFRMDHIGFLSENVDKDAVLFSRVFGPMKWSAHFIDPLQEVIALFGKTEQGVVYELLQPLHDNSPISKSLKARKNVINHVCYRCDVLSAKAEELRDLGFFPVTEAKPGVAFAGHLVQFFYHANGMMLEIVEGHVSPFDVRPPEPVSP